MIRILIVDDSTFLRKALRRVFDTEPDLQVIGEATTGKEALDQAVAIRPDLITLDVVMPGQDGLEVLDQLRERLPTVPVVMISGALKDRADLTLEALERGAVDFVDKTLFNLMDLSQMRTVVEKIRVWGQSGDVQIPSYQATRSSVDHVEVEHLDCAIIAIGCSTGGPAALNALLPRLPADFPVPIVVGQHMPQGFTRPFADRLNRSCQIEVAEARDGDLLIPGRCLIAPAGRRLEVGFDRVRVATARARDRYSPNIDAIMTSAARIHERKATGILLTGMGDDGARGLLEIRRAGGSTFAESQRSAVIYGMPKAAVKIGAVDQSHSLEQISDILATIRLPSDQRSR